jgi:myo-inositol 2-dehydrogenase/D-chiro-inositol 1-dehydrogenase
MKHLQVAVIGAGRIGAIHCETLASMKAVDVVAIVDSDIVAASSLACRLNLDARVADDEATVFSGCRPDAVIICTPTRTHADLIIQAAEEAIDVFCEKPVCESSESTQEILQRVAKSGIRLQVGFNRRFDSLSRSVHSVIHGGAVGSVRSLRITSRDPSPPPLAYLQSSGGLFRDMAIHDFDLAMFLMNQRVVEVVAIGAALIDPAVADYNDVDVAITTIRFEHGPVCVIENSRQSSSGYHTTIEVHGSDGSFIAADPSGNSGRLFNTEGIHSIGGATDFATRFRQSYEAEMQAFINCVRTKSPPPVTGLDGLNAILVAEAADRSCRESIIMRPKAPEIAK